MVWGVEIIGIGNRLVAILKEYDLGGFTVFLLPQHMALEDVIAHLRGGGRFSALHGQKIPYDISPLERYLAWRQRATVSYGPVLAIW